MEHEAAAAPGGAFRQQIERRRGRRKLAGFAAVGILAAFAAQAMRVEEPDSGTTDPITLPSSPTEVDPLAPGPLPTPSAGVFPTPADRKIEVADFGSNPGTLRMYKYVPAGLPRNAPLVLVMHGCNSSAASMDDEPGWIEMADRYKFALVFPETSFANEPNYGCFRSWDPAHNRRGVGESLSIKQMVDWMRKNHATSKTRTFATGFSSGAINTSVLLASYPDVFAAGATMAGHPYRCSSTYDEFVNCNLFSRSQTPAEWGDLVRAAYPGYTGTYPRVSIWHGMLDTIVNERNAPEVVKQWTNVHGIDDVADVTDLVNGHAHAVYTDSAGTPKVEHYRLTGLAHQIAINPLGPLAPTCGVQDGYSQASTICSVYYVVRWFGIAD